MRGRVRSAYHGLRPQGVDVCLGLRGGSRRRSNRRSRSSDVDRFKSINAQDLSCAGTWETSVCHLKGGTWKTGPGRPECLVGLLLLGWRCATVVGSHLLILAPLLQLRLWPPPEPLPCHFALVFVGEGWSESCRRPAPRWLCARPPEPADAGSPSPSCRPVNRLPMTPATASPLPISALDVNSAVNASVAARPLDPTYPWAICRVFPSPAEQLRAPQM